MRTTTLVLAVALLAGAAAGDEVLLKSGGRLSGRVVSRTATAIEVDVGAGRITVPTSSVLSVEEGRSSLQEYEQRAGTLTPGDADGWVALGQWADARGLGTQAREAYHRALAASPGDPRANEALGNVRVDGGWVTRDEAFRALGYVQFEGEWITPAEHEAILRERAAQDARDRERREADRRVREAEARAEEAEARAKEAEAQAREAQEETGGIPLWYAWGGGPNFWPAPPVPPTPPRPPRPPVPPPRPVPRPVPR